VNAGRVDIFVSDDGIGIPPEEKAKIFQKFYQIEASFTGQVQGMGLGLALVKRVAEAHGGDVRVESSLGSGSTFTLSLPIKTV
jgi:signal transduction histidine kinase